VGIGEVTATGEGGPGGASGANGANGRNAVILDRDGTLIDVVRDEETGVISTAFHPDQLVILPTVLDALRLLADAGYILAIATNQPGPAKGQFSAEAVKRTNEALVARLAAREIRIARTEACMHHPEGGPGGDASLVGPCDCRKPKAGMLTSIARELGLDARRTWMVGDSAADVEAGAAAGMPTGLVFPRNRCELCPLRPPAEAASADRSSRAHAHVPTLPAAATAPTVPAAATVPTVHGATRLAVAKAIVARANDAA
jgi:D-glycero-D-manno-heptose 1,7-bisphosphate phosphatase